MLIEFGVVENCLMEPYKVLLFGELVKSSYDSGKTTLS